MCGCLRAPLIVPIAERFFRTITLTAALGFSASSALAQDTAAAGALFEKGLVDMQAGNYESGCPALEESYRIDPLPGVLFTSAECHAQWGKYATAVARYEDYLRAFQGMRAAQRDRQHGRDEITKQKLAEFRPLVPQLTLVLPAAAPDGTVVRRGSLKLGKPSLGVPIPIDPGEHLITTEVPGGPVHEQRISIAKSEKKTVELEIELPSETRSATPPGPSTADTGSTATLDTQSAGAGSSRRTLAYIVGGIGLAGGRRRRDRRARAEQKADNRRSLRRDALRSRGKGRRRQRQDICLDQHDRLRGRRGRPGSLGGPLDHRSVGQSARSAAAANRTAFRKECCHAAAWSRSPRFPDRKAGRLPKPRLPRLR